VRGTTDQAMKTVNCFNTGNSVVSTVLLISLRFRNEGHKEKHT